MPTLTRVQSGYNYTGVVKEGDKFTLRASDLDALKTYSLSFSSTYDDDFKVSINGNTISRKNAYGYHWTTFSAGSTDITIEALEDSLSENNESVSFYLYEYDNYYRYKAYGGRVTIQNVNPSSSAGSISASVSGISVTNNGSVNEGDSVKFDLSGYSANQYYYYTITGLNSSDTTSTLSGGNRFNSLGQNYIALNLKSDNTTEGDETVTLKLYSDYNRSNEIGNFNITVKDTSKTPSVSINTGKYSGDKSNPVSVNEGAYLYYNITSMQPGKYYSWKITGIDSSDSSSRLSGYFYNRYSTSTTNLSIYAKPDNTTEGDETIKFEFYEGTGYNKLIDTKSTTLIDTSTTPITAISTGSYYGDKSNPESVNEGAYLYYNVTGMQPGKYYSWKITGIDSSDSSSRLSGYFYNRYSTSATNLTLYTNSDFKTEGDETIKFELYEGTNYNKLVGSKTTTLKDTSTEPVIGVNYGVWGNQNNPEKLEEGTNNYFTLSNLSQKNYYWKFEGIDSDDVRGSIQGSFYSRYRNSRQNIPLNILSDDLTEGDESVTFTLSTDSAHQDQVAVKSFTIEDTSVSPVAQVEITDSNIRSNEGESALIPLDITTFPTQTQSLYWKLSGTGLEKSDLATRFGDLSEQIKLGPTELRTLKIVRGTQYRSGSYNLKIPFAKDETTEGTETYSLEFFDNASLSGDPFDSANITVYDTSIDPPKSTLNSASIEGKTIKLYFSDKVNPGDISGSFFKINRDGRALPINTIKIDPGNTSATVSLKIEPDAGEKVSIIYAAPKQAILQDFEEIITVTDINKPIPVKGVAFAEKVEMRFSERLNESNLNKTLFEVKAGKRIKKIASVDLNPNQGIVTINLSQKIDINDDDIKVSYFDLGGNQTGNNLEDVSGNDVDTFKGFVVTNEAIDDNDISVTLAEVEESIITLGFDIELDSESIPNNGMFRVKVNNNKSKVEDITLNSRKREAYLTLKKPVTNGDVVSLTYIDAKGNQKRNVIQSKYGGDLGTFKDLSVENLSPESVDAPDIIDAYYEKDSKSIVVEFDEIISATKVRNSRFKPYTVNKSGKKSRLRVSDVLTQSDDTVLEIVLKSPIDPSTASLFFDYRDPKGDQKNGVIQDVQGNDLLNLKGQSVEI